MKDIKDIVEDSINFGLGLAVYSREKIEALVEEMVQKGEVAQKDARQFASDLVKKGEEQRDEMQKMVRKEVTVALDKMDLAKKSDIKEQVAEALREAGLVSKTSPAAKVKPGKQES